MDNSKNRISTSNQIEIKNILLAILYGIIIILPQFLKGGYYEQNFIPPIILINLVFLLWLFNRRKSKEVFGIGSPASVMIFCISLLYLLSISYGVNKKGSLLEFLKYSAFLEIVIMGYYLSLDKERKNAIILTILLGGLLNSIIGIGVMAGSWDYIGALSGNRLNSVLLYPNTLAAYNAGLFILAISQLMETEKKLSRIVAGSVAGIMLFTFILTYSRAMWILFPIILIFYFLFQPNNRKIETILYIFAFIISSFPTAFIVTRSEIGDIKIWIIFALVILLSVLFTITINAIKMRIRDIKVKNIACLIGGSAVLAFFALYYIVTSTTSIDFINDSSNNKWSRINRKISNVLPQQEYLFKTEFDGNTNEKSEWFGRVTVTSYDNEGSSELILEENLTDDSVGYIEIPFNTPENSQSISISFSNYNANTSVKYISAQIVNNMNDKVSKIPLKYKYVPESIISRLNSISSGDSSFSRRLTFNKDGLSIVKDYFFFGAGGKGWETLYERYQSEPYSSKLAHNYFLQLWIEAGIFALALIIGLLALLTYLTILRYKGFSDDNDKIRLNGLFFALVVLFVHSAVDFDMSLFGFAVIVWAILGIISTELNYDYKSIHKIKRIADSKVVGLIIALLAVVALFFSSSMMVARFYSGKAVAIADGGNIVTVEDYLKKAVKLDPYEPIYKNDLANIELSIYATIKVDYYIKQALKLIEENIKNTPLSTATHFNAANFYLTIGEINLAMEHLDLAIEAKPLDINSYVNKLSGGIASANHYFSKNQKSLGRRILKTAMEVEQQIEDVNSFSKVPIIATKEYIIKLNEAKYLFANGSNPQNSDEEDSAYTYGNYFDIDLDRDGFLDMVRISRPTNSNINYSIFEDKDTYIRITNDGEKSGFVYPYGIELEPNTKYRIEVALRGTTLPEVFSIQLISSGAETPKQAELVDIAIGNQWNEYSIDFNTSSDIAPGNQQIRLIHSGQDPGYVDIKSILIFRIR